MKKYFKIIFTFIICMAMMTKTTEFVSAAQNSKQVGSVLRVAYCPISGFFDYDEAGNEVGYGVEVLNKIAQFTGIEFEYVKANSWEDTKRMLIDGEADIRMPGTMPSTTSTILEYSTTSILDTYEVLLTLKSREDLYYEDYDTIKNLKIAITTAFYNSEAIEKYLDSIGVTEDQFVFCSDYNQCLESLNSGKVDALITNIVDMSDDMKMLERFNSVSNYITTLIDSPYMNIINDAVTQIKLEEPMFFSNLYEKWFPDYVTIPMTLEESEYLAGLDTITFAFRKDEGYLSHYSNGEYYGIYVEQAKLLCEKLGKKFKAVSIDDCLNGTQTTDVYTGFFYDKNYAQQWGFSISSPIKDINYYIVQKKEKNYDPKDCRIAAVKKFKYTSDYLEKYYSQADFLYCDSYEDCLKAVESGYADMTIINNYIAEYYLGMYQYSDLSAQLSNEYSHMFCLATGNNNVMLASILTKGLSMITESEMYVTYISGQEDKPKTDFFNGLLYKNPGLVILAVSFVAAMLIALAFLLFFSSKKKKQNIQLEKALSTKNDFLARMSHDMRTPLNVIIGMEKLARDNENPDDTNNCLEKIDIASEFLLGLINDILDIERINSGVSKLDVVPYSHDEFKKYMEAIIIPLCQNKGVDFKYTSGGYTDFVVMQDKLRINQIYFNLLSNAVKFTPEGGKITYNSYFTKTEHGTVMMEVTISDNGIGMSEEFQKHMFEAFAQENQVVTPVGTGTGLGLTIVKKMCDLMNIDIQVKSKLEEGTTFVLKGEFDIANTDNLQHVKENQNGYNSLDFNNKLILVCEDHPINQEIIKRILEKRGFKVSVAENGKEGFDKFKMSLPSEYFAILMDIRMPIMDGIETTKAIRALDRDDAKSIPIIALTANAYEEDVNKCMEAGMNYHLAKPIKADMVYDALEKFI